MTSPNYANEYYSKNKDRIREQQKRYYRANRAAKITKTVAYHKLHPDRSKESTRKYRENNREKTRQSVSIHNHRVRESILKLLGGVCSRCGFTDKRALQIDHRYGGGTEELKRLSPNSAIYRCAREHPEDYQLLCANCNWIKRAENGEIGGRRVVYD